MLQLVLMITAMNYEMDRMQACVKCFQCYHPVKEGRQVPC